MLIVVGLGVQRTCVHTNFCWCRCRCCCSFCLLFLTLNDITITFRNNMNRVRTLNYLLWVAQWVLVDDAAFTCVLIFSESQSAIKSLSGFVNNSMIFFLSASPLYHWCKCQGTTTFRQTAGQTKSSGLPHSFRNCRKILSGRQPIMGQLKVLLHR